MNIVKQRYFDFIFTDIYLFWTENTAVKYYKPFTCIDLHIWIYSSRLLWLDNENLRQALIGWWYAHNWCIHCSFTFFLVSFLSNLEMNYLKLPRKLIKDRETIGSDQLRQGIKFLKVCKYNTFYTNIHLRFIFSNMNFVDQHIMHFNLEIKKNMGKTWLYFKISKEIQR